jgi:hypothetical protein
MEEEGGLDQDSDTSGINTAINKLARKKMQMVAKRGGEMSFEDARAAVVKSIDKKLAAAQAVVDAIKGKTLGEMWSDKHRAAWIRVFDAAHNSPHYQVVSPEGNFVGLKTTSKGNPANIRWGTFPAIGKSVSVLRDGTFENISNTLGNEHKIRHFYTNIIDPSDPRAVTIDTHAIAADLVSPMSGSSVPVLHNFGRLSTAGSKIYGMSGTYPVHHEAYQQAAAEAGVIGRAMQSITWEAVRGLFTPDFKRNKKHLKAADAIWQDYQAEKITQEEALGKILEYVKETTKRTEAEIFTPEWATKPSVPAATTSFTMKGQVKPAPKQPRQGSGINAEVAPNPDLVKRGGNRVLNAWSKLPETEQFNITMNVGAPMIHKIMGQLEITEYDLDFTLGGFEGDTNPSITIHLGPNVSYDQGLEAAKVFGTLFRQKEMITYDETDKTNGSQAQFVKVVPSRSLDYTESSQLFKAINAAYPAAAGVSTRDGALVFGNFDGVPEQEFIDGVDGALESILPGVDYSASTVDSKFRSDSIKPVTLEGTIYGQVLGSQESRAERNLLRRRQRDFDSLQSEADARFKREVEYAAERNGITFSRRRDAGTEQGAGDQGTYRDGVPRDGLPVRADGRVPHTHWSRRALPGRKKW